MSTAAFSACAIDPSGKVQCMGSLGSPATRTTPIPGVSDAVALSVESSGTIGTHACAVTRAGTVMSTSSHENRFGELGTGDLAPAPFPGTATVRGLSDVVEVAAGGEHACARDKPGRVLCWGSDAMGQVSGRARGLTMCAMRVRTSL